MELKETKTIPEHVVPAVEETKTIAIMCDCCKKDFKRATEDDGGVKWECGSSYNVDTTRVVHETGSRYPDSTNLTFEAWHVCPKCFNKVVKPFMESTCGPAIETSLDY